MTKATQSRGLVLVAAVGVLGVLSVMGMAFASVMRLEARAARNFTLSVRAEFTARAGIEDAISRLRSTARDGTEYPFNGGEPAAWYTWRGTAGGGWKASYAATEAGNHLDDDGDGSVDEGDGTESGAVVLGYVDWVGSSAAPGGDTYALRVEDAASRVNVNAGDNLGTILDNLCRLVGPPLCAADQYATVPKWFSDMHRQFSGALNADDRSDVVDLFYGLETPNGRPIVDGSGKALYGDGYAIAGYRARHGAFLSVEDVRNALTWIERADGDGDDVVEPDTPEERMEIEAKFAALRPYITVDSWVDTDQIGYGKFEQVHVANQRAIRLVDRNRTWNTSQNDGEGELKGCFVAIINGVGQGQLKTIAKNTIDTLFLSNSAYPGSEMLVPPNHESSYIIIGKDHRYDTDAREWRNESRLYARNPLSIHRAPVNVNTATGTVLSALLLGLQTSWGPAGFYTNEAERALVADWHALCPSILSVGRDGNNALFTFGLPCPDDSTLASRLSDANLARFGHPSGNAPFCFFCRRGVPFDGHEPGHVGEAHYLAWQLLKEREQTREQDERRDTARVEFHNGHGPFEGWDDLYFRVFRPWERGVEEELSVPLVRLDTDVPRHRTVGTTFTATQTHASEFGHPGVARLCMANFNSNTDILKFQPNIEWINRWGANFTELYLPHPDLLLSEKRDVKLRIRPGELLDKTDLNVGTTEFCFDSGGVYEIESIGTVSDGTTVLAQKKYAALVRIYDVWRESTQREFVAGKISNACGAAGSQTAGQVTADQVSAQAPGGGSAKTRKSLCIYPEPVVPGDAAGPDGTVALALDRRGKNVKPAGYDGQIMLATNMLMTSDDDGPAGDEVSFYDSFTGQVSADFAVGDPKARIQQGGFPLDEVGLLGAVDSTEFDLPPIYDRASRAWVEGEGKGGDLRPDGVYLGVTKYAAPPLDGSFEFDGQGNIDWVRGSVSMWVKPTWHHGTYMRATLPVNYLTKSAREKGCSVPIKKYGSTWPALLQTYQSDASRGDVCYVRERFEHEFFNGSIATNEMGGRYGGLSWDANGFVFRKTGDTQNTMGDRDMPEGGPAGTSPFGALHMYLENHSGQDFCNWIPGWTIPLANERHKPFYQMCPYRWFFLGLTWNYVTPGRANFSAGAHCPYGQLREYGGDLTVSGGGHYDDQGRPDESTPDKHLSLVMLGNVFVDTMNTWDRPLHSFAGDDEEQKLETWAHAQYGTTYQWGAFPFGGPDNNKHFGINRVFRSADHSQGHFYQQVSSGTYATIDEFTISKTWHNAHDSGPHGRSWPVARRTALGRYYFERREDNRPSFTSQSLFDSERAQAHTFRDGQRDEEIELGCVRWYSFAPHFCIQQPGLTDYQFPYDSYFLERANSGQLNTQVSQSWRPGPARWQNGSSSRNSSQRGCTVSIETGTSDMPADAQYEHTDPEDWSPILVRRSRTGQHARSTPGALSYVVRFGFSREEYRRATTDAVLLDSPVFDDITITYLRRPKVLTWRDVSE